MDEPKKKLITWLTHIEHFVCKQVSERKQEEMGWVIKMLIGTSDVCKGGQNPRQMIISSSSINELKLGDKQNNGIHNDDLALTIRLAHCVVRNCPCAISQWKFCLHISNVTFVAPLKELREMKSHLCVGWKDCRGRSKKLQQWFNDFFQNNITPFKSKWPSKTL